MLGASTATSPSGTATHPMAPIATSTTGTKPRQLPELGAASTGVDPHHGKVHAPIASMGRHPRPGVGLWFGHPGSTQALPSMTGAPYQPPVTQVYMRCHQPLATPMTPFGSTAAAAPAPMQLQLPQQRQHHLAPP